jgi:hypothetical protein
MLIFKLLSEFEDLKFKQIYELVTIFNATQLYSNRFKVENKVIESLNHLEFDFGIIYFDAQTLSWKPVNSHKSILYKLEESKLDKNLSYDPHFYKYELIGFGTEFVYGLYLPAQKIQTVLNNRKTYPIKIGKTNNISRRIKELSSTGNQPLAVDFIFCTNAPFQLEKYIHNILKFQLAQIDFSNRREWFQTNKQEVFRIYSNFIKSNGYF